LACVFATTDDVPTQLLPYTFNAATTKCSNVVVTNSLNEQVYAPIRKTVQAKLGCNPFRYTQPFAMSGRPGRRRAASADLLRIDRSTDRPIDQS
jgi:hypothetical protein